MSYSIIDISNDLRGVLHGTTVNQITNFYGLLYRAASDVLGIIDPEETRRTVPLATPIYGQAAYDYAAPSDLKGNRIIDLRPQANRKTSDVPVQLRSQDFDRLKSIQGSGTKIEVRNNSGLKTLRIGLTPVLNFLLNDTDTPTSNGSWSVGGGASGLTTDNLYFVQGASSLSYSLSGSGYLENSTMNAADLTQFLNQGVLFVWTYCQTNLPSSFALSWGSDASNYWTNTASAQWDGTAFRQGWNLIGFPWASATKVGSPDVTKTSYLKFTTTIVGTATPVRLDSVTVSLGSIYELEYYSKFLFRDVSGAFKEKPTADTDLINLDTDSYPVYFTSVAKLAAQQQQGKDSGLDMAFFEKEEEKALAEYFRKYPSQAQKAGGSYYQVVRSSYANRFGRSVLRP